MGSTYLASSEQQRTAFDCAEVGECRVERRMQKLLAFPTIAIGNTWFEITDDGPPVVEQPIDVTAQRLADANHPSSGARDATTSTTP